MAGFNFASVPQQKRCRWFVRQGATTRFDRGFRSKEAASKWIDAFGPSLDWRVGFRFRLKGDVTDVEIIDRQGQIAQP
ncbi:hypothetical protein G3O06_05500 [Burkholderia sp. Ac-20345]|uniref:hypothetical protein n=1 Tax=Burkholderia sp. Ac-20345 TaxID=2703891 RepID=UPI00197BA0A9|nr:hypothetical protein [Burkholderia sp. Ac-20345]MBN3777025.1 hypothetical protein [Burkholderia sp. Ac-20345]